LVLDAVLLVSRNQQDEDIGLQHWIWILFTHSYSGNSQCQEKTQDKCRNAGVSTPVGREASASERTNARPWWDKMPPPLRRSAAITRLAPGGTQ
ncbi:unnamed protein product, partial [Amoebophrya sp. A25]